MPSARKKAQPQATVWQPEQGRERLMILAAVLKENPIGTAYRLNYVANFYVGPLVRMLESQFKMTRSEWIVLFCLSQQPALSAQQISVVTGRPKTSISAGVNHLLKKKLIERQADVNDGRRQVLRVTAGGTATFKAILMHFITRETEMMAILDLRERRLFDQLLQKLIDGSLEWASPY